MIVASQPVTAQKKQKGPLLGLTRRRRIWIYLWSALALVVGFLVWVWLYLQPSSWYTYTDHVSFERVAREVKLGRVVWEPAAAEAGGLGTEENIGQAAISSDGTRMVYATGKEDENSDLFVRLWDGTNWDAPRPMRALNSIFHESAPALSADGQYLFFASDRPGGRGGEDIWVAKWDGIEYAWPLPLTGRVNTVFDETDPAPSPDGARLYLSSNRPYVSEEQVLRADGKPLPEETRSKGDYNLYAAEIAGDTPFDLIIERQLSMLYSLREGALADPEVMAKLGGSSATESAVDRGLSYLAKTQEKDGRWDIGKGGGQRGHDVGATAFALLSFYGRGERHDQECEYQDTVARGLQWLLSQQNRASGDLRGANPQGNAMYDHGIASLALIEAYGVTKDPDLRPRAIAAIEFMGESQHKEGGWRYKPGERGDLSATGWYIMALGSAQMSGIPVPEKILSGARAFLEAVRGGPSGGSYGYTDSPGKRNSGRHGMNAAGFFCSQLLGASPIGASAFESAQLLGSAGLKDSDLYYIYYGTVAAYQHQGPLWREWREKMQGKFLEGQDQDGSWQSGGGHGKAMGRIIGTALTVLCLEAHYRYTPLYGLGYEPNPDGPVAGALNQSQVPETPLFRHAKYLEAFNSPAHDTAPVVTDHGDFLYFSSEREGGFGGSDIYRARISGPLPGAVANLGEEINSSANEGQPAVRMVGFHLLFNSDREGRPNALYSSKSRRLDLRHDYTKFPSLRWLGRNGFWLLLLIGAPVVGVWQSRRALSANKNPREVFRHV